MFNMAYLNVSKSTWLQSNMKYQSVLKCHEIYTMNSYSVSDTDDDDYEQKNRRGHFNYKLTVNILKRCVAKRQSPKSIRKSIVQFKVHSVVQSSVKFLQYATCK